MTEQSAADDARVSLVVIATGLYVRFVPELLEGARQHVAGLDKVYVLSDRPVDLPGAVWLPWGHLSWPYPTLLRYRAFTAYRSVLESSEVLFYVDVDMRFVDTVDLRDVRGMVAVHHPGYVGVGPDMLPYERRPQSVNAILPGEGVHYFAGGFQGGPSREYLDACEIMASWLQQDLAHGILPIWHDESAWNRWNASQPPQHALPPSFCSPEHERHPDAIIVALDKDHDDLRDTRRSELLMRRFRRAKASPRRVAGRLKAGLRAKSSSL